MIPGYAGTRGGRFILCAENVTVEQTENAARGGARIVGNDFEQMIRKIVVQQLDVTEDQVTREAKFIDDLGADSLDIVELVMTIEEEFGVEIPDEDAEKIVTVGDAINYLERKKG